MSISVIVVDDENIIRESMKTIIQNNIQGFTVVATFADGSEAIEYLENNRVDICITDIKINNVSGLELCEFLCDSHSHTKAIVISGYSDFEYARGAMKYGVKHYLLKPTEFVDLKKALLDTAEDIEIERNSKANKKEFLAFLREQLVMNIFGGMLKNKTLLIKYFNMAQFNVVLEETYCAVLSFQTEMRM